MHADQLAISTETARNLIQTQFPDHANEEVTELRTPGTVNAIFRVGENLTARFPLRRIAPAEGRDLLAAEVDAMRELAECSAVPCPQPIGIGRPDGPYPMPWLLQTWVSGEIATPDGLSSSRVFALDLARLVLSLRTADLKGRRFDGKGRGGRLSDHDDWMAACFSNSEGLLDVPDLRRRWSGFRTLPPAGRDVMSHRDLTPANLLVKDDRLVGVLDAGSFGPADPALDLIAGWHLLDRDRRALFLDATGADETERLRAAAWAFVQAMGLVWYYKDSNPIMSALGRSTLARLRTDAEGPR